MSPNRHQQVALHLQAKAQICFLAGTAQISVHAIHAEHIFALSICCLFGDYRQSESFIFGSFSCIEKKKKAARLQC